MLLRTNTKLAVARAVSRPLLLARQALGKGPTTVVRRRGLCWELDLEEGVDLAIYLLGSFEASLGRVYQRLVRPGATVLDVGANVGAHTLPLARCAGPHGRVIAFEPTEFAIAKLRRNLELNPVLAPAVTAVQALLVGAAGGAAGAPLVFSSWPLSGGDQVHLLHGGRAMSTRGAEVTTLDDALRERGVTRVDFIKIDTDGHEPEVLEGAAETLRRSAPTILMELAPYTLDEAGSSVDDLLSTIRACGYRLYDLRSGAPLDMVADELCARIPEGAGVNLLAKAANGRDHR